MDSLTNELFERIVAHLDLRDIQCLRLANRSTASKAVQTTLRSFYRTKHVDITRSALEDFSHMTSHHRLGCNIEHLTLIGIVYDFSVLERIIESGQKHVDDPKYPRLRQIRVECGEDELARFAGNLESLRQRQRAYEELQAQEAGVALLKDAFSHLAASSKGLQSLTLEVVVYIEDAATRTLPQKLKNHQIFERAAETFVLTMAGLRESRLPLRTLNIFSTKPRSLGCSLYCNTLNLVGWNDAFEPSLRSLEGLAMSISQLDDAAALRAQLSDEKKSYDITQMVTCCPRLKELNITGFTPPNSREPTRDLRAAMHYQYMRSFAQAEPWSHLKHLSLGGLHVTGASLATFIKRHLGSLRSIELREILFHDVSLRPFLSILADGTLEKIHLEDLWIDGPDDDLELVHFSGETEQEFAQISGDSLGRNIIDCWGEATKQLIELAPYLGPTLDSPKTRRWRLRRREEFGWV